MLVIAYKYGYLSSIFAGRNEDTHTHIHANMNTVSEVKAKITTLQISNKINDSGIKDNMSLSKERVFKVQRQFKMKIKLRFSIRGL